jgi:hypothetical protein
MKHEEHKSKIVSVIDTIKEKVIELKNDITGDLPQVSQKIIKTIPPSGIIIFAPGIYIFGNDIEYQGNTTAITIIGSDITLDMNGYKLINRAKGDIGILASLGENITIINGKIINFGMASLISILNSNIDIDNLAVCKLTNDDISLSSFGILCVASKRISLFEIYVNNVIVKAMALSAMAFVDCSEITIANSKLKNLANKSGVCSGISFMGCLGGTIDNVHVENLTTDTIANEHAPGHTAIGFVPYQSSSLTFTNCSGKNITGGCDDAHFMSLYWVKDCKAQSCVGEDIVDGVSGKGAKATGIEVYADNGVENANIEIVDCQMRNIKAINPGDRQAAGYSVAGSGVTFRNCTAENIKVYKGIYKTGGIGVGFGWAPDIREVNIFPAKNVLYDKCLSRDCQSGFDMFNHQNSIWKECQAIKCDTIISSHVEEKVFYCDKCSECPQGPTYVTVTNVESNNSFI